MEPEWEAVVEVGPVPVPVHVKVPIKLSGKATVGGEVKLAAGAGVSGALGIEYRDGRISPIHEFSEEASLEHKVSAAASAEALIGPDISIEAGWDVPILGTIGADVGAGFYSGLRASYDPALEPPGKICVPIELTGSAHFDVPVEGKIGLGPETLPDKDVKCVGFGGRWVGSIKVSVAQTGSNEYGTWNDDETAVLEVDGQHFTYKGNSLLDQSYPQCQTDSASIAYYEKLDAPTSLAGESSGPIVAPDEPGKVAFKFPLLTPLLRKQESRCNGDTIERTVEGLSHASNRSVLVPVSPSATHLEGLVTTTVGGFALGEGEVPMTVEYDLEMK